MSIRSLILCDSHNPITSQSEAERRSQKRANSEFILIPVQLHEQALPPSFFTPLLCSRCGLLEYCVSFWNDALISKRSKIIICFTV